MTKIHEDNENAEDEEGGGGTDAEEEEEGGEGAKKEASSQKIVTQPTGKSLKRKRTTSFSMNSIDVSRVNQEDLLTLVKMKRLKNLFNVCRLTSVLRNPEENGVQLREQPALRRADQELHARGRVPALLRRLAALPEGNHLLHARPAARGLQALQQVRNPKGVRRELHELPAARQNDVLHRRALFRKAGAGTAA